jgi:hypothetical protein
MKISLTRLLNEIKLTNKKIDKKLQEDVKYFDVMSSGKLKAYKSEEDMNQTVDAHVKSIDDLITQRDNYKRILLNANNSTTLTVGDAKFTIAEAIAKKETVTQELKWIEAKVRADNIESTNEAKLDDLIKASIGKDKKTDAKEIEDITNVFRKNNKVTVADPSGVEKLLESKRVLLDEFISNIDFSLSEINAKTEVEI